MTESGEKKCIERILSFKENPSEQIRQLEETLALGLLVAVKWDRAKKKKPQGVTPDARSLANADVFMDSELAAFRESARISLEQHVARVALDRLVSDASGRIVEQAAASKTWWGGVCQNVFASFVWSAALLLVGAIAIKANGGDFGVILDAFRPQKAEAQPMQSPASKLP